MKQLAILTLALIAPNLFAQWNGGGYRLSMAYDRPGLNIPHWQISLPEHGDAQYTGKPIQGVDPGTIPFAVSDAGRAKLGTLLEASHNLQPCETKSKGIANMGQKSLTYAPAGAPEVQCSFNYTDNKPLSQAAEYLVAVVNTIQTGIELDRLHRYDRLGLDAVMLRLVGDIKEGRAAEIVAIRPTLQRLVEDEALMERVRTHAQQLLDLAKTQTGN